MQLLKRLIQDNWRILALYGGLFAGLGALLYWQLGSLLPGYSAAEETTHQAGLGITGLLDRPFNAPFLIVIKLLSYVGIESPLAGRLVAVGGGLLTLGLFCALLRAWTDTRTAIMGTILFGTSAWFLHVGRAGTTDVMLFGAFALFAAGYWFKQSQSWVALLACFGVTAAFLYTPGMIWFVLVGLVWQWKTIDHVFKRHLITLSGGTLALLATLVPLGWAFFKDRSLISGWLGIPNDIPSIVTVAKDILLVPYHLVIGNKADPAMWLGTAPVLDIFCVAMFVVGGYLYLRHIRLLRTPIMLSVMGVSMILIALGPGTITLLLPFVYLVIAAGVGYTLNQWLQVFPRNPIARSIGVVVMAAVIALSVGYNLRHYFIGWPQAQDTHNVYTVRPPAS